MPATGWAWSRLYSHRFINIISLNNENRKTSCQECGKLARRHCAAAVRFPGNESFHPPSFNFSFRFTVLPRVSNFRFAQLIRILGLHGFYVFTRQYASDDCVEPSWRNSNTPREKSYECSQLWYFERPNQKLPSFTNRNGNENNLKSLKMVDYSSDTLTVVFVIFWHFFKAASLMYSWSAAERYFSSFYFFSSDGVNVVVEVSFISGHQETIFVRIKGWTRGELESHQKYKDYANMPMFTVFVLYGEAGDNLCRRSRLDSCLALCSISFVTAIEKSCCLIFRKIFLKAWIKAANRY